MGRALRRAARLLDVAARPVDGAQGLRFACDYDGNRADAEMCILLAFTDAPVVWAGGMLEGTPAPLGADDDGVAIFDGACDVYWVAR